MTPITTYNDDQDLKQCKEKCCQSNSECTAFEYIPETKVCHRKNAPLAGAMGGTVLMVPETGTILGSDKIGGECIG